MHDRVRWENDETVVDGDVKGDEWLDGGDYD